MQSMYYVGLDVGGGKIHAEGTIPATRFDLDH